MSLYRLKTHFDYLVNVNSNSDILNQLENYRYVCAKALQKIENNEKVADHMWYRLELARVIYKMGFDAFKKEVEPYLCDWFAPAWIQGVSCQKQFFKFHWKILNLKAGWACCVQFCNFLTHSQNLPGGSTIFDLQITSASLVKSSLWNKNDYSKCLLQSPQNGLLFFDDRYYGLLDYDLQKALLYDFNDNNKKMDFSDQVPWNAMMRYSLHNAYMGVSSDMIILAWSTIDQGLEGVNYYKIKKNLDLSSKKSYKKSVYWANKIDREGLSSYSHKSFSWYAVEFFCRRSFFKYFHRLLPEHKYLYIGLSSLIVGKITMLLGCAAGVFFFLVARCFFLHKVAVCFSLLTSLLIVSFILRGHWMYVVNMLN